MKQGSSIFIILLISFGFFPKNSSGQGFQSLNKEFPLSLSEEIFEDAEGFLWIGTVNGLILYNGYNIRMFRHNPNDSTSLAANNINAIGQDNTGRIWVGVSRFGFSVLDQKRKSFIHPCIPDTSGNCAQGISVNAFAQAGDTSMWVGSSDGLHLFSSEAQPKKMASFRHNPLEEHSLSNDYVTKTYVDRKGRLWVGTVYGINLYDQSNSHFINHRSNSSFPSRRTMDIVEDNNGKIWISTRFIQESLLTFDETTQTFIPALTDRSPYIGEYKMTFDQNNDLWATSRGVGVYHFDMPSGKQTFFDPGDYKIHGYRNINGLNTLTDRYGNVWITGNNLHKWPATGKSFSSVSSDENLVVSVYANEEGFWYSDQEFKHVDRTTRITTPVFPGNLPNDIRATSTQNAPVKIVYCIKDFDNDHIILTTTRNVFLWNTKTNAYKEFPLNVGGPIREFVVTPDKKHLWLCANQKSPVLFDLANGTYYRPDYASAILNVRSVAQDKNGDLWFGSVTSGLFYLNTESHEVEIFSPDQEDPSKRLFDYAVNDIAITDEYVYVATNLGLQIISKKSHNVISQDQSFFADYSFMSILEDNAGEIWMGTQNGLLQYSPNNKKLRTFTTEDGLTNTVYAPRACYKDAQGQLYFGGDKGVDFFNPEEIGINNIPPNLYLGRILINNHELERQIAPAIDESIDLKHTENFIEVELLALHFTAPSSNVYAYRIPELDTSWRDLGLQRKITLANLRPGSYTLQARAANADDVWCDSKTLLHIQIAPPYWATWWFIALCLSVFITLTFLAYRYRIIQIKTRERLKSEFNKRVTELESKALRSQMNPHFLFNSLNSVKSLISQGNNEKATQYLTRFGQLIRQILANSEKPFVRLQEELEALRLYLEIEQLRFQNFTYEIIVHDNVNADFIEVPPLIIQPYVENAIWHGLMHLTSGERRLTVVVAHENQMLHLTIEDNGIGRQQAQQIKSLGNSRKGGMGLRLTEDRLNLLETIYGQDVKITITDLMENGHPSGTRVEVQIPCTD